MRNHFKKHGKKYLLAVLIASASATAFYSYHHSNQVVVNNPPVVQPNPQPSPVPTPVSNDCAGIDELWQHVYTGDPRKFQKPQDRLTVIEPCKTVTGVIKSAVKEADSDWHIRLDVDDKSLLNEYNIKGQHGYLVLEPVCANNPPTQKDVIKEGVCDNFSQDIFNPDWIGQRVTVVGAFVTDEQHLWNEIHPILTIIVGK